MCILVITGYGSQYEALKVTKTLEAVYFRKKNELDLKEIVQTIEKEVERIDLRFKGDFRGN